MKRKLKVDEKERREGKLTLCANKIVINDKSKTRRLKSIIKLSQGCSLRTEIRIKPRLMVRLNMRMDFKLFLSSLKIFLYDKRSKKSKKIDKNKMLWLDKIIPRPTI